ncbi:flagellar assembly protein FliW [Paenibacillus humicola]|uniref:flagellar assembly protein FliW n=1 Tax=Paenibacillus humicola TaxID=3110540 RepID=UPI00237BF5F2|nr:flagellar assembly protein FliW [Paenibacillus humicola]
MLQLHGKVIQLNGSLLGLEAYDAFLVSVVDPEGPYAYLQSLQEEKIGFLVVTPFLFYSEYTFELDEKNKLLLDLKSKEEVLVLNTVTIREPFTQSTVNLLAPIVVNLRNGQARQIVLPPKTQYGTTEPLFRDAAEESGE